MGWMNAQQIYFPASLARRPQSDKAIYKANYMLIVEGQDCVVVGLLNKLGDVIRGRRLFRPDGIFNAGDSLSIVGGGDAHL
jgi:hypothetical protein